MIARLSELYKAFFQELHDRPNSITVSSIRTSSETLAFLDQLVAKADRLPPLSDFIPGALVVVGDSISLRAAEYALAQASIATTSESRGESAISTADRETINLFILDLNIIGMSGIELCRRLRKMSQHQNTPIIFITPIQDYPAQVQSPPSGASDVIARPYSFAELSLMSSPLIFRAELAKSGLL